MTPNEFEEKLAILSARLGGWIIQLEQVRNSLPDPASVEAARNPWKEAVLDACSVNHLPWDENDPRKTMTELLAWERMVALNPKVSEEAAARETMTAEEWLLKKFERGPYQIQDEPRSQWEYHILPSDLADALRAYAKYLKGE